MEASVMVVLSGPPDCHLQKGGGSQLAYNGKKQANKPSG